MFPMGKFITYVCRRNAFMQALKTGTGADAKRAIRDFEDEKALETARRKVTI